MSIEYINDSAAPKAIGPYSQATRAGGFLFVAGQIPMDPDTLELVNRDIRIQAARALANLEAVLAHAGLGWGDVMKTTIFLTDMSDFGAVNEIYGARIGTFAPARTTIAVAGLPRGARVEVECIAKLRHK